MLFCPVAGNAVAVALAPGVLPMPSMPTAVPLPVPGLMEIGAVEVELLELDPGPRFRPGATLETGLGAEPLPLPLPDPDPDPFEVTATGTEEVEVAMLAEPAKWVVL